MPSGYTANLYDGKNETFQEFVLHCARAFGALVLMRDDAPDAPIPDEFKPETEYHDKELASARQRLAEASAWTIDQADDAAEKDHAEALEVWRRYVKLARERVGRYEAMLKQVQTWKPPTSEHDGLKVFMVQQLEDSIKFDGSTSPAPVPQTGEDFRLGEMSRAQHDIEYHTEHRKTEIVRAKERSAWVTALKASLNA